MDFTLLGISLAILLAVIGLILLNRVMAMKADDSDSDSDSDCPNTTPASCNQCGQLPCQCAQILPGQTRCPICPGRGNLGPTALPGVQCCDRCRRAYRCPGCLLN